MTLADACDVAYLMLLREAKAVTAEQRLLASLAMAQGAKVAAPDYSEAQRALDEVLAAPDEAEDPEKLSLLRDLGLRS